MTSDNGKHDEMTLPPGWTEAKIARLLERFFVSETSRPHETVSSPSLIAGSTAGRSRRSVNRWLAPLCAVSVLSCGWLLSLSPVVVIPLASELAAPPAVEIEAAGLPFRTEQVSFAGDSGEFTQRNEWRQTQREYLEPNSGRWVKWSTAELTIEIEPVKQFADEGL